MIRQILLFLTFIFIASFKANVIYIENGFGNQPHMPKCSESCRTTDKYRWIPGKVLPHKYEAFVHLDVLGKPEWTKDQKISTEVRLHVITPCDLELEMHNTHFMYKNTLGKWQTMHDISRKLEKYRLSFAIEDGVIRKVCPHPNEIDFVVNVKKGVLSVMQNSMKDLHRDEKIKESDVSGKCFAHYHVRSKDKIFEIESTKDLAKCTETSIKDEVFAKLPFIVDEFSMNGKKKCMQKISPKGFLIMSECLERMELTPPGMKNSKHLKPLTITVRQKLEFVGNPMWDYNIRGYQYISNYQQIPYGQIIQNQRAYQPNGYINTAVYPPHQPIGQIQGINQQYEQIGQIQGINQQYDQIGQIQGQYIQNQQGQGIYNKNIQNAQNQQIQNQNQQIQNQQISQAIQNQKYQAIQNQQNSQNSYIQGIYDEQIQNDQIQGIYNKQAQIQGIDNNQNYGNIQGIYSESEPIDNEEIGNINNYGANN